MESLMGRRKPFSNDPPAGSVLAENLIRLGFADTVVRTTEVARLVTENTGRSMSRQRVANLLNAIHINPETIAVIAEGLNVDPSELTRKPPFDVEPPVASKPEKPKRPTKGTDR